MNPWKEYFYHKPCGFYRLDADPILWAEAGRVCPNCGERVLNIEQMESRVGRVDWRGKMEWKK